ncbi:hypothetical protein PPERSA_07249 [Pseudocohnilembus persalinus]|uniref:Uncharacterized protein n=1 Tax=Pseudocohnilembus persalinus TaxID=266149 RepID=A0A0V0QCV0_PSEPJ|nr:hypothetical protein PPERSA_07249 [Pseudocohnilembus persalinus]|eukprot:KRX00052.1 hypothetical protein PPERSA_07249 [Pseudocohnilembus persalinus]
MKMGPFQIFGELEIVEQIIQDQKFESFLKNLVSQELQNKNKIRVNAESKENQENYEKMGKEKEDEIEIENENDTEKQEKDINSEKQSQKEKYKQLLLNKRNLIQDLLKKMEQIKVLNDLNKKQEYLFENCQKQIMEIRSKFTKEEIFLEKEIQKAEIQEPQQKVLKRRDRVICNSEKNQVLKIEKEVFKQFFCQETSLQGIIKNYETKMKVFEQIKQKFIKTYQHQNKKAGSQLRESKDLDFLEKISQIEKGQGQNQGQNFNQVQKSVQDLSNQEKQQNKIQKKQPFLGNDPKFSKLFQKVNQQQEFIKEKQQKEGHIEKDEEKLRLKEEEFFLRNQRKKLKNLENKQIKNIQFLGNSVGIESYNYKQFEQVNYERFRKNGKFDEILLNGKFNLVSNKEFETKSIENNKLDNYVLQQSFNTLQSLREIEKKKRSLTVNFKGKNQNQKNGKFINKKDDGNSEQDKKNQMKQQLIEEEKILREKFQNENQKMLNDKEIQQILIQNQNRIKNKLDGVLMSYSSSPKRKQFQQIMRSSANFGSYENLSESEKNYKMDVNKENENKNKNSIESINLKSSLNLEKNEQYGQNLSQSQIYRQIVEQHKENSILELQNKSYQSQKQYDSQQQLRKSLEGEENQDKIENNDKSFEINNNNNNNNINNNSQIQIKVQKLSSLSSEEEVINLSPSVSFNEKLGKKSLLKFRGQSGKTKKYLSQSNFQQKKQVSQQLGSGINNRELNDSLSYSPLQNAKSGSQILVGDKSEFENQGQSLNLLHNYENYENQCQNLNKNNSQKQNFFVNFQGSDSIFGLKSCKNNRVVSMKELERKGVQKYKLNQSFYKINKNQQLQEILKRGQEKLKSQKNMRIDNDLNKENFYQGVQNSNTQKNKVLNLFEHSIVSRSKNRSKNSQHTEKKVDPNQIYDVSLFVSNPKLKEKNQYIQTDFQDDIKNQKKIQSEIQKDNVQKYFQIKNENEEKQSQEGLIQNQILRQNRVYSCKNSSQNNKRNQFIKGKDIQQNNKSGKLNQEGKISKNLNLNLNENSEFGQELTQNGILSQKNISKIRSSTCQNFNSINKRTFRKSRNNKDQQNIQLGQYSYNLQNQSYFNLVNQKMGQIQQENKEYSDLLKQVSKTENLGVKKQGEFSQLIEKNNQCGKNSGKDLNFSGDLQIKNKIYLEDKSKNIKFSSQYKNQIKRKYQEFLRNQEQQRKKMQHETQNPEQKKSSQSQQIGKKRVFQIELQDKNQKLNQQQNQKNVIISQSGKISQQQILQLNKNDSLQKLLENQEFGTLSPSKKQVKNQQNQTDSIQVSNQVQNEENQSENQENALKFLLGESGLSQSQQDFFEELKREGKFQGINEDFKKKLGFYNFQGKQQSQNQQKYQHKQQQQFKQQQKKQMDQPLVNNLVYQYNQQKQKENEQKKLQKLDFWQLFEVKNRVQINSDFAYYLEKERQDLVVNLVPNFNFQKEEKVEKKIQFQQKNGESFQLQFQQQGLFDLQEESGGKNFCQNLEQKLNSNLQCIRKNMEQNQIFQNQNQIIQNQKQKWDLDLNLVQNCFDFKNLRKIRVKVSRPITPNQKRVQDMVGVLKQSLA